jgi:hypothetical protein
LIGSIGLGALILSSRRFTMLPPFIIEQIRRREEEQERARHEQPQLEIPAQRPVPRTPPPTEEQGERGVIIIDLMMRATDDAG